MRIVHQVSIRKQCFRGASMEKSERKTTTQPKDWWREFEKAASKSGLTLAAWMGECCKTHLPKRVQKSLSVRPPAHRPSKDS